jgi:hypothetical protein
MQIKVIYSNHYKKGRPVSLSKVQQRLYKDKQEGLYCLVVTDSNREFEKLMLGCFPKSECELRFNGGNQLYTVFITDKNEIKRFECFM